MLHRISMSLSKCWVLLSVYLSVCVLVYMSVCLSVWLCVYLLVCFISYFQHSIKSVACLEMFSILVSLSLRSFSKNIFIFFYCICCCCCYKFFCTMFLNFDQRLLWFFFSSLGLLLLEMLQSKRLKVYCNE